MSNVHRIEILRPVTVTPAEEAFALRVGDYVTIKAPHSYDMLRLGVPAGTPITLTVHRGGMVSIVGSLGAPFPCEVAGLYREDGWTMVKAPLRVVNEAGDVVINRI